MAPRTRSTAQPRPSTTAAPARGLSSSPTAWRRMAAPDSSVVVARARPAPWRRRRGRRGRARPSDPWPAPAGGPGRLRRAMVGRRRARRRRTAPTSGPSTAGWAPTFDGAGLLGLEPQAGRGPPGGRSRARAPRSRRRPGSAPDRGHQVPGLFGLEDDVAAAPGAAQRRQRAARAGGAGRRPARPWPGPGRPAPGRPAAAGARCRWRSHVEQPAAVVFGRIEGDAAGRRRCRRAPGRPSGAGRRPARRRGPGRR